MRNRWAIVGTGLVLAAGCGAEEREPPPEAGDCAERTGSYLMTFDERSGNCGQVPEQVIVMDSSNEDPNVSCKGGSTVSADNCSVTIDLTCTYVAGEFAGQSLRQKGTMRWSTTGESAAGTLQHIVTGPDTSLNCSSTYNVKYSRQ